MANTTENPNEETIKCVVVGDNNVGKTRLICARAYSESSPNSRCHAVYTSHVPTVWAIDQYRMNEEVLQNARCVIDGTMVSLRLWDTFGDHHKNRKFAYGKADVVVICFSICDGRSLQQVTQFWKPEVRKHCKNIPIILVGCKVDLRFADLAKLNQSKGYLSRSIHPSDILYPDKCHSVATELNCPYYETSVVLKHGIHDVFENVCRAALVYRRNMYFWNTRLRKILRPTLQVPLKPPVPDPPIIEACKSSIPSPNLLELFELQLLTDVAFICQGGRLSAHKAVLAASSSAFFALFTKNCKIVPEANENFDEKFFFTGEFCQACRRKRTSSNQAEQERPLVAIPSSNISCAEKYETKVPSKLTEPISLETHGCLDCLVQYVCEENNKKSIYRINLSYDVFNQLMYFCYCGKIDLTKQSSKLRKDFEQLLFSIVIASQRFGLSYLEKITKALINNEGENTDSITQEFLCHRSRNIKDLCIDQHYFSDVLFHADNGLVRAHKILLAGGCDMMNAMFAGPFIESENKEVYLPQTSADDLRIVFGFIYLDQLCYLEDSVDICELITLANRLCLQNLISRLEFAVVDMFMKKEKEYQKSGGVCLIKELCENAIHILHISQLHNAPNLSKWCLHFLSVNYNNACWNVPKLIKSLPLDIQQHLEKHRWPPVWYIKQRDHYDKSKIGRHDSDNKKLKRA